MNIRKLIMMVTVATMTLATTTCFAMISKSDLNIDGINYGQPLSEVYSKYGKPRARQRYFSGYYEIFSYGGDSIGVETSDASDAILTVVGVTVNGSGNLRTKAGINIGSMLADIKSVYGEPDEISEAELERRETMYWITYVTDIEDGNQYMLRFTVTTDGKVESMGFRKLRFYEKHIKPKHSQRPQAQQQRVSSQSTIPAYVTEIPKSELNIGGINPGQDINYVERVYGKPTKIDDEGFFQTYNYNDKFIVKAKLNKGYKVTSVASYEKGLKMPGGFMVGMPYADVVKKHGKVNGAKFKGTGVEAQFKGCTEYTYYSGDQQAVFIVDKKGIVQGIRVEDYDEQKFIEAKRKK